MHKLSVAWRVFILIAGLTMLSLVVTDISLGPANSNPNSREILQIRALGGADDPRLGIMLDQRMVTVPAGDFLMGSDSGHGSERPAHRVYLDAYEIDQYEVTNIQYDTFVEDTGARMPRHWSGGEYPTGQADTPVVGVSWDEAAAYCAWAGERLPTEAEWEKACRGSDGRIYPWGDAWDPSRVNVGEPFSTARPGVWDEAWSFLRVTSPSPGMPSLQPVGSHSSGASPFRVVDMAGNAAEWVSDWYNWSDYSGLPDRNPQASGPPWDHSVRGSSWYLPYGNPAEAADKSRCSARNASHAGNSDARLGFRCARTP